MDVSVFARFEDAEALWREAERVCAHYPYQAFDWLSRWYEEVGAETDVLPQIVLVRDDDGTPLLLLPLAVRSSAGVRVLGWLGEGVNSLQAPLLHPRAAERWSGGGFAEVWQSVRRALAPHAAMHLGYQPERIGALQNPVPSLGVTWRDVSQQAELVDDWDTYYAARVPLKVRKDYARRWRRLDERGDARFVVAEDAETALAITERMMAQKSRQFIASGFPDPFEDEGHRRFYHRVAAECVRSRLLHASAVYCDGHILATHWALVVDGWMCALFAGHEAGEWDRFSAGHRLRKDLFEWLFAQHFQVYDFSLGDERYKGDWANRQMTVSEFLQPVSPWGRAYTAPRLAHRQLKTAAMQVAPVRRASRSLKRRLRTAAARARGRGERAS